MSSILAIPTSIYKGLENFTYMNKFVGVHPGCNLIAYSQRITAQNRWSLAVCLQNISLVIFDSFRECGGNLRDF